MELEKGYEKRQVANILRAQGIVKNSYELTAAKIGQLIADYGLRTPEAFTFSKNKILENRLTTELGKLNVKLERNILENYVINWNLANQKNDKLAAQYLRNVGIVQGTKKDYFNANVKAMNAFINRTTDGMNLSAKVWKATSQVQAELETYLGTGITVGRSAAKISQDVRQLLKEPDKLFRRVRSETGKLVLSKAAKGFHPGRGVYRSAYKNSLRLTATETNMAYRTSDYTRRQQLDFVMGIRVHTSNAHPRPDICDDMAGDYPKDFIFRGWHPWCLCFTTSILMSGAEYRKMALTGEPPRRAVNKIPDRASLYLEKNKLAILKSEPYFFRDNFEFKDWAIQPKVDYSGGLYEKAKYLRSEQAAFNLYNPTVEQLTIYEGAMMNNAGILADICKQKNITLAQLRKDMAETRAKIAASKQTKQLHFDETTQLYTYERQRIHEEIADRIIGDVKSVAKPKLVMTGGYPGSGKSSVIKSIYSDKAKKMVTLDSDIVKEMLAKADGVEKLGWRAQLYHEEADDILHMVKERCVRNRKNILLDGTMKTYETALKTIETFKKSGYTVELAFADLPMDKSIQRAVLRYLGDSGRFVDPAYICTHYGKNLKTFERLKDVVEGWYHYSTDTPMVGSKPFLVAQSKAAKAGKFVVDYNAASEQAKDYIKNSPEVLEAIKAYTDTSYSNINDHLRFGRDVAGIHKNMIEQLDSLYASGEVTMYKGKVYRSFRIRMTEDIDKLEEIFNQGVFMDKGFMSTSVDFDVSQNFKSSSVGFVNLEIQNARGVAVELVSYHTSEKEVILNRGSKFSVVKYVKRKAKYFESEVTIFDVKLKML